MESDSVFEALDVGAGETKAADAAATDTSSSVMCELCGVKAGGSWVMNHQNVGVGS